jgi:5-methylcytosine-specific restriction protein A
MTKADQFRDRLGARLRAAEREGVPHLDVNAGDLHREVGGYPGAGHQMPNCCRIMYEAQRAGDQVLSKPPSGKGASLTIRYRLPR